MDTTSLFDGMADRYDTQERVDNARIIARAIREAIGDARPARAMDYGCGTGLVGLALADLFGSILFVDASPQMVARVQDKVARLRLAGADTLCADFSVQVPPALALDCILLSQVLLHVPDDLRLLQTLRGLLRAGGRLVLVDFDKNPAVSDPRIHNGFDQAALAQALRGMGYTGVASHTFYHGEKMFMHQDASLFILTAAR